MGLAMELHWGMKTIILESSLATTYACVNCLSPTKYYSNNRVQCLHLCTVFKTAHCTLLAI